MGSGDRQRGGRRRLAQGSGTAVVVALLLVLAWGMTGWAPDEQHAVPAEYRAAPRSAAPPAAFSVDTAPLAAAGRGALGPAAVAVEVLAGHPPTLAARRLGPGMSAEQFRALYEADPGDGAAFMFIRRPPPAE